MRVQEFAWSSVTAIASPSGKVSTGGSFTEHTESAIVADALLGGLGLRVEGLRFRV